MSRLSMRRSVLLWIVCLLLALLLFTLLVNQLGQRASQEGLSLAEKSIRRAAVQCYALEGTYPADFSYLVEQYGVAILWTTSTPLPT